MRDFFSAWTGARSRSLFEGFDNDVSMTLAFLLDSEHVHVNSCLILGKGMSD